MRIHEAQAPQHRDLNEAAPTLPRPHRRSYCIYTKQISQMRGNFTRVKKQSVLSHTNPGGYNAPTERMQRCVL